MATAVQGCMTYRDDLEALKIRHAALARELDELQKKQRELEAATTRHAAVEREVSDVRHNLTRLQEQRKLPLLDNLKIASPCSEKWDEMLGDERVRHCLKCDKNVYDVSAMTRDAAESLIRDNEGRVCLRLYKRKDGTVLTSDCPVGQRRRRVTKIAAAMAFGSAAIAGATLYGEVAPCRPTGGPNIDTSFWDDDDGSQLMGDISEPVPLMGSVSPSVPPPPVTTR